MFDGSRICMYEEGERERDVKRIIYCVDVNQIVYQKDDVYIYICNYTMSYLAGHVIKTQQRQEQDNNELHNGETVCEVFR